MPPQTQTRRILIKVDTQGNQELKSISEALGRMSKNTKDLATSAKGLSGFATSFISGISIRTVAGFSDEIQNLNNRLLVLNGNQVEATQNLNALVDISRETNQSLNATSESYFRMSQALKDVNVSQDTLLELTKTISNTFRLSGASTQEAANATIQLGQAFSLGVLRGQDLRSVMSQNVVLTRLLRREFGSELLKAAEKGLITVPKLMQILFNNMKQVNEQAKLMSATFEQSFVKALDAAKLKIFEISSALGLQGIFGSAVEFAIKHMDAMVVIFGILTVSVLPSVALGIYNAALALGIFNKASLITIGFLSSLAIGFVALAKAFDIKSVDEFITTVTAGFHELIAIFHDFNANVFEAQLAISKFFGASDKEIERMEKFVRVAQLNAKVRRAMADSVRIEYEERQKAQETQKKELDDAKRRAADIAKVLASIKQQKTAKELLTDLNREFLNGALSIEQYNKKFIEFETQAASAKFREGEIDLSKKRDLERKAALHALNIEFKNGRTSIQEYNAAVAELGRENLSEDLEAGKISLSEFNAKIASVSESFSAGGAFRTGLQDYLNSIGTTTQNVAAVITDAFKNLEDVFVDFVKNGEINFNKFTEAVLDDLTRIIVRASIIQPLAQGLLGAFTTTTPQGTGHIPGGGAQNLNAKGNVFDRGLKKYATGGIVDRPTIFAYGKGGTTAGLMGEKGAEAILPLARGRNGNLGVQAQVTPVNINIINQSGSEVSQNETVGAGGERTIDIIIANKVREQIVNGQYDRAMKSTFGLSRKGT